LTEELSASTFQPRDGSVFLTSLDNSERGSTSGVTITVPLELAAQLLVKATHRLADEAEVMAYKGRVEVNRSLAKDTEVLARTKYLLETKEK
jgi:hypothetical protein